MKIEYDSNTTLGAVVNQILNVGYLNAYNDVEIAFTYDGVRYWICDEEADFGVALNNYIDPLDTKKIYVEAFIIYPTGRICVDDGVEYYMHSNEGTRHNEPHVHISETGYSYEEATISILTGKVLAGKMPQKLLKKARKRIKEERNFFIQCWNAKTNGLAVDINKVFFGD